MLVSTRICDRCGDTIKPPKRLSMDRYGCLANVNGMPTKPCEFGKTDECHWGIASADFFHCSWEFVRQHPGGATLEEIGNALLITRERVRQIEESALAKIDIEEEE